MLAMESVMDNIVVKLTRVQDIGEEALRVLRAFDKSGRKLGEGEFVLDIDASKGPPKVCTCNCGSASPCGGQGNGC
jgi:hypothetical protein